MVVAEGTNGRAARRSASTRARAALPRRGGAPRRDLLGRRRPRDRDRRAPGRRGRRDRAHDATTASGRWSSTASRLRHRSRSSSGPSTSSAPGASTATSGRSNFTRSERFGGQESGTGQRIPCHLMPGNDGFEKFLRFGEGRRKKRLERAGRLYRHARARVPAALRRGAEGEDRRVPASGSRTARSWTTCSSRRSRRCARRASGNRTSACSTSR